MKGIYSFGLALALAGTASAQNGPGTRTNSVLQHYVPESGPVHPAPQPAGANREIYFSEDFANGMAGNNGIGAWTFSGPNGNVWRYTHTGPNGMYNNAAQEKIASPTAANGFMIFNSDSVNTNWAVTPIAPVDPRVPLTGSLISPVIDLSAQPAVEVRFSERFRACCSDGTPGHFIDVSTDGGNNWTTRINVEEGVEDNDDSETRLFKANLLQAIAADPSNVRLRFTQDGANGISAYHWQIDDITIEPLPDNELKLDYGYASQFGGGYEFGMVPQSQMVNTLNVGGSIINYGKYAQTNVVVNVSLLDASSTEVGTIAIDMGTINPGDTALADDVITLPTPMDVSIYTTHFTISSDSIAVDADPTNNTFDRLFSVTNNLYSIDGIGVYPASVATSTQTGTTSFTDNTTGVRLLNYFEVHAPTTFYGVDLALGSNTQTGSMFTVSVYDTTNVLGQFNPSNALTESEPHVVTNAERIARRAHIAFLDPLNLSDDAYFVSVKLDQTDGKNIYIVDDTTVPQPGIASMLYIPNDSQNQFLYGGNGNAWGVRISTDATISVKETAGLAGVQVYPNPTTGVLHIHTAKAEPTTVEVRNMLGAIVETATFNGTVNTLDLAGNAAGLYSVRISNGTHFSVERITLQ